MKQSVAAFFGLLIFLCRYATAQVVINEVMYHDPNSDIEYVELFNAGTTAVELSGWTVRDNQDDNIYRIPNGTVISPQGYLVITDDPALFSQIYGVAPSLSGIPYNFANSTDAVRLFNAAGSLIERVEYTDRSPFPEAADGEGSSIERINSLLPANLPAAWGASPSGGTPGAMNFSHIDDLHPVITQVDHSPRIPQPGQEVTITARVTDFAGQVTSVQLYYGFDGGTRYDAVTMMDDGQHSDGSANDGVYAASVAGMDSGTILRFYVEAANSNNLESTIPAQGGNQPYLTVFENPLQGENVSVHRVVMRPEVNQQFLARYQTDEYFPAAFYDGDEVYYQVDIRHRGRSRIQNGRFKIQFPEHQLYRNKIERLNYNGTDTATIVREYLSFQLYQDSGIPNLETELVRFHINGESTRGTAYRVAIENPDSQFLKRRLYFEDDDGNLYKTTLDGTPENKATWRFVGDDPDLYRGSYIKQTNEDEDDFTDIIEFCRVLSEAEPGDADYEANVRSVLDVDVFLRWMAVSAIVAHWDSPYTDHGHNYVMYNDPDTNLFNIIAWDLNGTFIYNNDHDDLNYRKHYTHIRSTKFPSINKILNHPVFGAQYFREIDNLLNTLFTSGAMNQRIDEARDTIKAGNSSVSFLRTYTSNRIPDLEEWINKSEGMAFITKPNYQANAGELYHYHAVAADYRFQQPVNCRLISAPDWLTINQETGELSGFPEQEGIHRIVIEAQNTSGVRVTQEYDLQVVDPSPRLILNFNEESGGITDLSVFQNAARFVGGARSAEGRLGSAASIGSRSAYLEVEHDDSLSLTGSITVEAWIRPNSTNSTQVILTKGDQENFNYQLFMGYGPFNSDPREPCFLPHRFDIENRAYYGRKEIEARLSGQQWVHLAGTYDSLRELVGVFVNNKWIVDSSARPLMETNSRPIQIGMNSNSGFQGVIDDIRILPFAKQAFAAGLCISQVDVSGISSSQDRIALSLSELRREAINTEDYCIYLVNSNQWISLPSGVLRAGQSITWWLDDLGVQTPLADSEIAVLYPKNSIGTAAKEFVLDQVAWGNDAPGRLDPGVQAAVWLPERSVKLPEDQSTTLALKAFADNDDMDADWGVNPQQIEGPVVTSVVINNDMNRTNTTNVQLRIQAENAGSNWIMRISNTPDMGESWVPFSDAVAWTLPQGEGMKAVYLQVMDANGLRSKVVTDSIEFNTSTEVEDWRLHR